MKKIILAITGILTLMAFSFFSFSFIQKVTQDSEFKLVWLTSKDWKELEAVSYVGKKQVNVVHKTNRYTIFHTVQYRKENNEFTKKQVDKLTQVLAKYE